MFCVVTTWFTLFVCIVKFHCFHTISSIYGHYVIYNNDKCVFFFPLAWNK